MSGGGPDAVAFLRAAAPWLFASELGTCIVGSHALAIACAAAGMAGPQPRDLDLAWALDVPAGRELLSRHGVLLATTDGNLDRGTLAMQLGGRRIEITTFRDSEAGVPLPQRIERDLRARDMTIGALALQLATATLHDPCGGRADFAAGRIVAVGDPSDRIREHPVRWLRYFRKAHELGFSLDQRVRRVQLPVALLDLVPAEALAAELRAALLGCRSPGRFFVELHECGLLRHFAPELDLQFDGRPAGPQRFHPEIGQALHMVLALEWGAQNSNDLPAQDRLAVLIAVLCHDLGKGFTRPDELPGHRGHERKGLPHVQALLDRLPGLADQRARRLALDVCALHVEIRHFDELRPGTLAKLYDQHFRAKDYPVDLFALAVAADSAGRLGCAGEGREIAAQITARLGWLRSRCEGVDAAGLRALHPDVPAFRKALHEARANALGGRRPH